MPARTGSNRRQFTQRQVFACRQIGQQLHPALAAFGRADVRYRAIEREAAKIEAEAGGKLFDAVIDIHQLIELIPGFLRLGFGASDDRHHARQDQQVIRVAAGIGDKFLLAAIEGLAFFQRGGGGKHHLGGFCR
ncbi:hypothetical protein D3C78_1138670 [compost metagenome]